MKRIAITHFLLTFAALVACFVWLAATNGDNSRGRHGIIVTYKVPVYWILVVFGQMFIGASACLLISRKPGYLAGHSSSRCLGGSRFADSCIRLIPAVIGLIAVVSGAVGLLDT
jgi:hypothetical protein